jgi:cytochrome c peroxidase
MKYRYAYSTLLSLIFAAVTATAQTLPPPPDFPPEPGSLKGVPVAAPDLIGLGYVVDMNAAIALGKAFFWDQQAGSDGLACGSCHFHAGADNRTKNAIDPGLRNTVQPPTSLISQQFQLTASNKALGHAPPAGGGPNYQLKKLDFPTHQLSDITNRDSTVLFDTDDIIGSQGVFGGAFQNIVSPPQQNDACLNPTSYIPFNVGGIGTRQVEPRNTPTVINAAYNFRNFWDGRANNIFNGRNPFGMRDPTQGHDITNSVVVLVNGVLVPEYTAISDSSLASQAVGPPTSNLEMSCNNRVMEDIGVKLLATGLWPLAGQTVEPTDSVLGVYSNCVASIPGKLTTPLAAGASSQPIVFGGTALGPNGNGCGHSGSGSSLNLKSGATTAVSSSGSGGGPGGGLSISYTALIQKAFAPKYWSSALKVGKYTQIQKNFPLFWGLAIQAYESTLISDDAPFDRFKGGPNTPADPNALTQAQLSGFLDIFMGKGFCIFCHQGPEFTAAASHLVLSKALGTLVEYMNMGDGTSAVYDSGFYNIGVRPPNEDIGVGGLDPWNNPLSFAREAKNAAGLGDHSFSPLPLDNLFIIPCNFISNPCGPIDITFRDAVDGNMKVPTLRNIELTGPYFHNGSRATLAQVLEFYNRGGDRRGPLAQDSTGYGPNLTNLDPVIQPLGLTPTEISNMLAFLNSLTDERVRWEKAPFDHPSLVVPNGQQGSEVTVNKNSASNQAVDIALQVLSTGAAGRTTTLGPVLPFDAGLQ